MEYDWWTASAKKKGDDGWMREITLTARTKTGKVVGTGKCQQFDSLQEAEKVLGREMMLALINRTVKNDQLNRLRRPAGQPSLARILREAHKSGKLTPENQKKIVDILKAAGLDVEID